MDASLRDACVCQGRAGCVSHHGHNTLSTTFITLQLKSKYRFNTGAIKGQQCPERRGRGRERGRGRLSLAHTPSLITDQLSSCSGLHGIKGS